MNEYLTKFAYKNAATEDLWESLSTASGKPVDMVMSTWTKKMGYPVLPVTAKQVSIYHYIICVHNWFTVTVWFIKMPFTLTLPKCEKTKRIQPLSLL